MTPISPQPRQPAATVLTATAPGSVTPRPRMTCTTTMPNARPAKASMVLYPSRKPPTKADRANAPSGAAASSRPMGLTRAVTTSTARQTRNSGLSTLPTQVRILPGRRENHSTAPKNTSENRASAPWPPPPPSAGATPTSKGTVAHRGMAKKGPMVR